MKLPIPQDELLRQAFRIIELEDRNNLKRNQQSSSGGGSGGNLQILSTDPVAPSLGQQWLLETIDNQMGTLQAFIGGVPVSSLTTDYSYRFSVNTQEGIKRVLMT